MRRAPAGQLTAARFAFEIRAITPDRERIVRLDCRIVALSNQGTLRVEEIRVLDSLQQRLARVFG
jgi:hypothetical protein